MTHSVLVAKPSRCARNVLLLIVGFHTTLFEGPRDHVSEDMVCDRQPEIIYKKPCTRYAVKQRS